MTAQLTLLQVDLAQPPICERKHLIGENVPGSVKLDKQLDNISGHWPAAMLPNPKHLHIIVKLPSKHYMHCVSEI